MQSTNSEYGSPYLAVCHVTFNNLTKPLFIRRIHLFLLIFFEEAISNI